MSHKEKPPLIWVNVLLFLVSFACAVVVAPWYGYQFGYSIEHWLWLAITYSFCNLSITAGYHRLWSHKTYEAHWSLRLLFALGGAFALQNSALHWSSDHRVHHKHVDNNDKDPYSAKRGFWFSHIGWMLRQYNKDSYADYTNCRDLQKDKIVMWQHKHYLLLALVTNIGIPLALGLIYQDIWGMLLMVGVVRLVLSHHSTFFINSLAHIWGSQPYTDRNTARDNAVLAVFTFGEGYHNYHHIFENDYRNGIYWWQYDPTKWLIKSCSWIGLTKRLRVTPQLKIDTAKAAQIFKMAKMKLEERAEAASLHEQLQREFDSLTALMKEYYEAKKQLLESKRQNAAQKYENALLTIRYKQLKADLAERYRLWNQFVEAYA